MTGEKVRLSTVLGVKTSSYPKVSGVPGRDCNSPSGLDDFLTIWSSLGHS